MKIRPLNGLVAVLLLTDKTLAAMSPLAIATGRSPGWLLARVVALPEPQPPGLALGDEVLIRGQSSPYGAGVLASEDLGLEPGGRVVFVPCAQDCVRPDPRRDHPGTLDGVLGVVEPGLHTDNTSAILGAQESWK